MEIWKDIPSYHGLYQISNYGKVKSLERFCCNHSKLQLVSEKILKPCKNKSGYLSLQLSKNGIKTRFLLHRLVAITFLKNINNFPEVNHKDGNKENNHLENLEWCTKSENIKHSYSIGLREFQKIKTKKSMQQVGINNSIPIYQIDSHGNCISSFYSAKEAQRKTGISQSLISRACKTEKTAGGYFWKYQKTQ